MQSRALIVLALSGTLAACGGARATVKSTAAKPAIAAPVPVRAPVRRAPPSARVQMIPGLEGVIGATPDDLARQFGPARLDVWEGDARKLQFIGNACVLDVFLYPPAAGSEPQATYVEARRASDGQEVDRVACVATLRGR
jgi:hypothetical protein